MPPPVPRTRSPHVPASAEPAAPNPLVEHIERMSPEEEARINELLERDQRFGGERAPDEK